MTADRSLLVWYRKYVDLSEMDEMPQLLIVVCLFDVESKLIYLR
jgi:hypothetical protein